MKSRKFSIPARLHSFKYAFQGMKWLIREEHNSWIHLTITIVLVPVCLLLRISPMEWTIIILCIGLVLILELINSVIERLLDKISPEHDPEIGKIKDLAAAAVLIGAISSAIAGLIILVPKFLALINPV